MSSPWTTLLAPYTIEDTIRAQAYEHAGNQERQMLKTAIAYHALDGESPSVQSSVLEYKNKGFWQRKHSAPAPTLFILCGAEYSSPARLIAATMPALLAGVSRTVFIQIGTPCPALLLALELLGIEEAYALPDLIFALEFLRQLDKSELPCHNQRLLLLHPAQSLLSLRPMLEDLHMPFYEEARPPRIFMAPTVGESMAQNIGYAQPDAVQTANPFDFAHAYYGVDRPSQNVLAQAVCQGTARYDQHLTQGMEACWHMWGLSKDFFLNHCIMAGTTFENEDEDER